jgi:uncharacterized protein YcaQ
MESISIREVRRLALAKAGLLRPEWTGLPTGPGRGRAAARRAAHRIIDRFGHLQLDSIAISGARTHAIVLLSRLEGFPPELAEALLQPGEPLFEYFGHEACWMPLELYPAFEFRRRAFRDHKWYGGLIAMHPQLARDLIRQIEAEGPMRSLDMESGPFSEVYEAKAARVVARSLWGTGELAIRERRAFQRTYDLPERVIPEELRQAPLELGEALPVLLLRALDGHGWATKGSLAATWRLTKVGPQLTAAFRSLEDAGELAACELVDSDGGRTAGWIRPADLELAARLDRLRPRSARGVLLSPFDPVLWDRERVRRLFGFDQVLEIYKPAAQRLYGYYCMPVLAGERLVARVDLKCDRKAGTLRLLSCRYEQEKPPAAHRKAATTAVERYAAALELKLEGAAALSG